MTTQKHAKKGMARVLKDRQRKPWVTPELKRLVPGSAHPEDDDYEFARQLGLCERG